MNAKDIISEATGKTLDITGSVLALAVACHITPDQFVKAYMDTEKRALFLADVTNAMVHAQLAEAMKKKEEKTA